MQPIKFFLFTLFFILLPFLNKAQNIILPDGEFMDTTFVNGAGCEAAIFHYYYSVDGKYPKSSQTLVKEAKAYLSDKPTYATVNGYITFRFSVNCEGKTSRFRVLQTDADYKETHFDKALVNDLYQFTRSLGQWKVGKNREQKLVNYIAFLSFKFKNGAIVAIIP
jgi:hypothetical protein